MGSSTVIDLPLLPLRDVVVYPHMVLPLFVGRERSIEALEDAMANDKQVLLVAQRNATDDSPTADGIYQARGALHQIAHLLIRPGEFHEEIVAVKGEGKTTRHGEAHLRHFAEVRALPAYHAVVFLVQFLKPVDPLPSHSYPHPSVPLRTMVWRGANAAFVFSGVLIPASS